MEIHEPISWSERPQPTHRLLTGSTTQTLMQGVLMGGFVIASSVNPCEDKNAEEDRNLRHLLHGSGHVPRLPADEAAGEAVEEQP